MKFLILSVLQICLLSISVKAIDGTISKTENCKTDTTRYVNAETQQASIHESTSRIFERMITHLPGDYSEFYKQNFNISNVKTYIGLTALTAALMTVDQPGWHFNRSLYNRSKLFHNINDFTINFGDGKYHFMLAGLFAAIGLIENNTRFMKTASNIVEALLASGLTVQVLKRLTGRESPILSSDEGGRWRSFPGWNQYNRHQPKYYSFPSGHMASATATLTVIINNFPQYKWIKPVGYSLLGILGVGLVTKGMHWYSDLPLGFFLGYSFGNLIAPVEHTLIKSSSKTASHISLTPYIANHNFALDFQYKF